MPLCPIIVPLEVKVVRRGPVDLGRAIGVVGHDGVRDRPKGKYKDEARGQ